MKILFISSGLQSDYQCDCLYHGLKSLYGADVESTNDMWFMYDTLLDEERKYIYGRGFTLYGLLDSSLKSVPEIDIINKRIKERYYQYVIYGSCTRDLSFLDIVLKNYLSNEVAFVDGEDITQVDLKLLNSGTYFKRELVSNIKGVYPISFAIPEQQIVEHLPEKSKSWATNYPGKLDTYIFETEASYFKDYQTSNYAVTFKKAGWDCLRHYEIIANGCIPYFTDIFDCPDNTMHNYPKDIIRQLAEKLKSNMVLSGDEYQSYASLLLKYCRDNLTTKSLANYVVEKLASIADGKKSRLAVNDDKNDISFINRIINIYKGSPGYSIQYKGLSSIQRVRYLNYQSAVVYANDEFLSAQNSLKNVIEDENIKIGYEVKTVDLLIVDHLLSYQENVHQYMLNLINSLNIGSRVIFIIPNYSNYGTILGFFKGDFKFGRLKMAKSSQVNFYSVKTIIKFLKGYGLKTLNYEGFEYDNNNGIKRFLNKRKSLKYWSCKKIIVEASLENE
jgi:hypothetical protein